MAHNNVDDRDVDDVVVDGDIIRDGVGACCHAILRNFVAVVPALSSAMKEATAVPFVCQRIVM